MTAKIRGKPVIYVTDEVDRESRLLVEVHPKYLLLRWEGERSGHRLSYVEALECIHRRDSTPTMAKYRGRD